MDDALNAFFPIFGLVFAIIDPFGYVPIFLSMTSEATEEDRTRMVRKATLAAFVFLSAFTILGEKILGFFDISIPALQISGGLILLFIGFEMLNMLPTAKRLTDREEEEGSKKPDISIVPLAIPMLSGPASIATVVVLSSKEPSAFNDGIIILSVLITLVITYFVLRFAGRVLKLLGNTGLNVITRIMGLLLCAMAIQFVINGWKAIAA